MPMRSTGWKQKETKKKTEHMENWTSPATVVKSAFETQQF